MTREPGKNLAASIRARLLALAQSKGEDYQRVLGRYAIERFLYRLGRSTYRDKFALKGATLFTLWTGHTHRPTKDLDLLGRGSSSAIAEVEATIRAICEIEEADGLSSTANPSRAQGLKKRTNTMACALSSRPSWLERGFQCRSISDLATPFIPSRNLLPFPVLLPMEPPLIRAYPSEAAIAEKFHAMVVLDIRNSRMKDFYDIWFMANTWTFEMASLRDAILASFERRGSKFPIVFLLL